MALFSIIIPTYNRAELIGKTIESVLKQDYDDFEVLIIDDGSTDNTAEVVKTFEDNRVKYFKKENGERGAARNFGIQKASGQYITFLDSDDLLYPNHFKVAKDTISKYPNIPVFHQAYQVISPDEKILSITDHIPSNANKALLSGNHFSCIGVFVRKDIFDTLSFSEDRKFSGTEDWLMWLQIAARFPILAFNKPITAAMVNHEERSVLSFDENSYLYRTNFLEKALSNDSLFVQKFGSNAIHKIKAHMLTYMSLHAAMTGNKKIAYKYLVQGIKGNFKEIFTKRFLVIIKLMLIG